MISEISRECRKCLKMVQALISFGVILTTLQLASKIALEVLVSYSEQYNSYYLGCDLEIQSYEQLENGGSCSSTNESRISTSA
jgi:hypothetical protein